MGGGCVQTHVCVCMGEWVFVCMCSRLVHKAILIVRGLEVGLQPHFRIPEPVQCGQHQ